MYVKSTKMLVVFFLEGGVFKILTFVWITLESKAHLYVPKMQGRLGAVDDVEGVGQR